MNSDLSTKDWDFILFVVNTQLKQSEGEDEFWNWNLPQFIHPILINDHSCIIIH